MRIRNKDLFEALRCLKAPFFDQVKIKLTQNCICFTNPCIILLVPFSVTREYHHKVGLLEWFRGIFFQDNWHTLSREVKKKDGSVIRFCLLSCAWGRSLSLPKFQCPPGTPGHFTHTSHSRNAFSIRGFEHFKSDFIAACSLHSLQYFDR